MKKKVIHLNLADLDHDSLIALLSKEEPGQHELFGILNALFQMFATSLNASRTVAQYGQAQDPDFLSSFIKEAGPKYGIPPQVMDSMLKLLQPELPPTQLH
jgi:hypothetical protein